MSKYNIQTGFIDINKQNFDIQLFPDTVSKLSVICKIDIKPELGNRINKALLTAHRRMEEVVVEKLREDYTPYDTGTLANSIITDKDNPGVITQGTPYAHYLYYGEVYGPNIPIRQGGNVVGFYSPPGRAKTPTGRELQYNTSGHPKAGPFWFERMKADCKDEIVKETEKALNDEMKE